MSEAALLMQSKRNIVSETVGDESIIVNLEDGRYHRVTGVASAIWVAMETPQRWEQVLEAARACAGALEPCIVARFVEDLMGASLVMVEGSAPNGIVELAASAPLRATDDPVIESYNDMADLLLLDPVHEVGEQGWPAKPSQPT